VPSRLNIKEQTARARTDPNLTQKEARARISRNYINISHVVSSAQHTHYRGFKHEKDFPTASRLAPPRTIHL